jgi:general secretion pathway protein G
MNRKRREAGFTLVELLVVMIIIAALAAVIVPRVFTRAEQGRRAKAIADISSLETAIRLYAADNGQPPTTEQGLQALRENPSTPPEAKNWNGPYLEKPVSKDSWGGEYVYTSPGEHNDDYDIVSYARDGKEGGEGADADIANWEEE